MNKCKHCGEKYSQYNQLFLCNACLDKCPGITSTVVDDKNSYMLNGKRYFRLLGGPTPCKIGDTIREWN